jgi:hypothetical protein
VQGVGLASNFGVLLRQFLLEAPSSLLKQWSLRTRSVDLVIAIRAMQDGLMRCGRDPSLQPDRYERQDKGRVRDFLAVSFGFDRVRRISFASFLVRCPEG